MKTYKSNWELGSFNKEQETLDVCWTIENEIVLNSYAEAQAYIKKNYYDFSPRKEYLKLKKTYFKMGHLDAHHEELVLNPNYKYLEDHYKPNGKWSLV